MSSNQKPVTAAIKFVTGQIVTMRFPDWQSFGEWAELNHELYQGMHAEPEKGESHDTLREGA